jgi:hypothetical protein
VCKSRVWRARENNERPRWFQEYIWRPEFRAALDAATLTRILWQNVEQQPERCHMLVDLSPGTPHRTAFSVVSLRRIPQPRCTRTR